MEWANTRTKGNGNKEKKNDKVKERDKKKDNYSRQQRRLEKTVANIKTKKQNKKQQRS